MVEEQKKYVLRNLTEELVKDVLERMLAHNKDDICTCEKCRGDMMAITLNEIPSKYVSTTKGEAYAKLDEMNVQYRADVVTVMSKAMKKVAENPQH